MGCSIVPTTVTTLARSALNAIVETSIHTGAYLMLMFCANSLSKITPLLQTVLNTNNAVNHTGNNYRYMLLTKKQFNNFNGVVAPNITSLLQTNTASNGVNVHINCS